MEWETTDPSQERSAGSGGSASILDDDAALVELLFEKPELIAEEIVLVGEARRASESDAAGRIVMGWRRSGGPLVLGATTGSGSEALLVKVMSHAARMDAWPLEDWNAHVRAYWDGASTELVQRIAARWGLSQEGSWDVAAWTRAAWGDDPRQGPCAVALVATRIPQPCENAIVWLASYAPIIAFRIRWYGVEATSGPRIEEVAGGWPAPLQEEETVSRGGSADQEAGSSLMGRIEALCAELGFRVSRHGEGWVRIDGIGRSLRAFPGDTWMDLQLVGIDEGSMVGLSYRFDVALGHAPSDAPPEVHLRLYGTELEPGVRSLLVAWLSGEPGKTARTTRAPRPPEPQQRKPRNPLRRTKPR